MCQGCPRALPSFSPPSPQMGSEVFLGACSRGVLAGADFPEHLCAVIWAVRSALAPRVTTAFSCASPSSPRARRGGSCLWDAARATFISVLTSWYIVWLLLSRRRYIKHSILFSHQKHIKCSTSVSSPILQIPWGAVRAQLGCTLSSLEEIY